MVEIAILFWLVGFGLRFLFRYLGGIHASETNTAYRQIIVTWWLRWPFGYLPKTGAVPVDSFMLQFTAFLIIAIAVIAKLLSIGLDRAELQLAVYGIMFLLSGAFTNNIWSRQKS